MSQSERSSSLFESPPGAASRMVRLSLQAAGVGVLAGFAAYALYALIGFVSNLVFLQRVSISIPALQQHHLGWWVLIVPAIGGVIVGVMARYGSDKIRGHGIPEAMEAVLVNQSRISPRVAILKPISTAISIGTGGPFGAEGPIIQTGGALGSLLGQLLPTTPAERKVLLACGAAAGMAATFSTPIAAVVLALELLLFEFKSRSFIPLVIASTLATTVHFYLMGRGPMFEVAAVDFGIPWGLPYYALFGILCGLVAVGFSRALYWVEDLFEHLPVDEMWWPAIGGLGLGLIGFFVPRVLGVGYDTITDVLNSRLTLTVLLLVFICKSLALLVSLGSGTSGGLLAPMFTAGAAFGGAFALLINSFIPGAQLSPGAYALVGMAAVFAAASRATFTFIIFAFEITRDYDAILPLMLVCVIADGVGLLLMKNSIMTEKLARRGLRVHHDYEVDVLHEVAVSDVMDPKTVIVPQSMSVAELSERIANHDPTVTAHQGLFIIDDQQRLAGVITRGDLVRSLERDQDGMQSVLEAGSDFPIVTYPDESLHDAVARMLANDVGRLPVVTRSDARRVVGYLGRAAVLAARSRRLEDEHVAQEGWLWQRKL
jgi:chloride channel protein, CIC family